MCKSDGVCEQVVTLHAYYRNIRSRDPNDTLLATQTIILFVVAQTYATSSEEETVSSKTTMKLM
jgi:hypothetical protein